MNDKKVANFEAISLILIVIISHLLLNIPQTIINNTGTSSVLNVIYVSIIAIFICIFIVFLMKSFPNCDIIDISDYLGGRILKTFVGTILILYLIFFPSVLLRNAIEALNIIYYFDSEITFIAIFFIITPIIANSLGEKAIIKCNLLITPIIIIVLFIAFLSVSPLIVWQRIFPIFGYGINNTFGINGLSNIFSFNGLLIVMLIYPLLSKPGDFKKISVTAISLTGLLLLLFVSALLLGFPYAISVESIVPLYLMVINTQFTSFFQRPEALFIFIWILFFMSYLNVITMFSLKIFKKISKVENTKPLSYSFSTLLFISAFIPIGMTEVRFLENTIYKYGTLLTTFCIFLSILIGANIKYRIIKKINMKVEVK